MCPHVFRPRALTAELHLQTQSLCPLAPSPLPLPPLQCMSVCVVCDCVHVYVLICVSTDVHVPQWEGHNLRGLSSASTLLEMRFLVACHCLHQSIWSMRFGGFSRLYLPAILGALGLRTHDVVCTIMWVLGIWAQVSALRKRVLSSLSHLPRPTVVSKYSGSLTWRLIR